MNKQDEIAQQEHTQIRHTGLQDQNTLGSLQLLGFYNSSTVQTQEFVFKVLPWYIK